MAVTQFVSDVPALMKFWDESNPISPDKVGAKTDRKYSWKCKKCGYTWITSPKARMNSNDTDGTCPCCDRNQVRMKGVNDLFTVLPEAMESYDFEKNKDIDIYSLAIKDKKIKIHWKCKDCGKEWSSVLAYRVDGSEGNYRIKKCQTCSGISQRTVISDVPEVMRFFNKELNPDINPNTVSVFDDKIRVNWKCPDCSYTFTTSPWARKSASGKCPSCESNLRVSARFNDVMTVFPNFADIYDDEDNPGIDIHQYSPYMKIHINCRCKKCGYTWGCNLNDRFSKDKDGTLKENGCPACKGLVRTISYAEQYPELAKSFDEEKNGMPFSSITGSREDTHKRWYWTCNTCGNSFDSDIKTMINGLSHSSKGCPYCSNTKMSDTNNFGVRYPELLMEYAPDNELDPFSVFPANMTYVKWMCKENPEHKWMATFKDRAAGKCNCPVCNDTRALDGYNSLSDIYPDIAAMWSKRNTTTPNKVFSTSKADYFWVCKDCNNTFSSSVADVVANPEAACPYCNDRIVLPGVTSFDVRRPDLMEEYLYVVNDLIVPSNSFGTHSQTLLWWKCPRNEKHTYQMTPADKIMFNKRHREPCPYCRGFRRPRGIARAINLNKKKSLMD